MAEPKGMRLTSRGRIETRQEQVLRGSWPRRAFAALAALTALTHPGRAQVPPIPKSLASHDYRVGPVPGQPLRAWEAQVGDRFGFSVDLQGDQLLVGVPYDDLHGTNSGSVASFEKIQGTWVQRDILAPPEGQKGDYFGMALALNGNECVVGAPWDSREGSKSGAVHWFRREGDLWHHAAVLRQPSPSEDAQLGEAIALSKDLLVVGARNQALGGDPTGAAYIWGRHGSRWELEATIAGSRCDRDSMFGFRVAIADGRVFVGAPGEHGGRGAVYAFERGPAGWSESSRLASPHPQEGDYFGLALACSSTEVLVGAPWRDTHAEDSGEAFLFRASPNGWTLQQRLTRPGAAAFGSVVALGSRGLVVGARGTAPGAGRPSPAHAFHAPREGSGYGELAPLLHPATDGTLCRSIALDGETVVLGTESPDAAAKVPGRATVLFLGSASAK